MANLQQIVDEVKATTRRYSQDDFITHRVKMAVKHIHSRDFFPMDRVEIIIPNVDLTLASTGLIGQFPIPSRWRTFETVRPLDSDNQLIGKRWEGITPQEIESRRRLGLDVDTYYVAGQQGNFKSSVAVYQLLISYFVNPNLTPAVGETLEDISTWITDSWEEAVHDLACAFVYGATGNQEQKNNYMLTYREHHEPDILRSYSYSSVQR